MLKRNWHEIYLNICTSQPTFQKPTRLSSSVYHQISKKSVSSSTLRSLLQEMQKLHKFCSSQKTSTLDVDKQTYSYSFNFCCHLMLRIVCVPPPPGEPKYFP